MITGTLSEIIVDLTGIIIIVLSLSLSIIAASQISHCPTARRWLLVLITLTGIVNALGFFLATIGLFGIDTVIPELGRPGALLLVSSLLYIVILDRYNGTGCKS